MTCFTKMTAASALLLAACNTSPTVHATNASLGDVQTKTALVASIEPGQWTSTSEVQAVDFPGLAKSPVSDSIVKAMKQAVPRDYSYCVTPSEAARPSGQFFGAANRDCKYDHFDLSHGRMDAKMICLPKSGGSATTAITGTLDRQAFDIVTVVEASAPTTGAKAMTMKLHSVGRRTGNCKA